MLVEGDGGGGGEEEKGGSPNVCHHSIRFFKKNFCLPVT